MNRDETFLGEALKLAREAAAEGEVPVGAVIVLNDTIIAAGRNRREKGKNALCHAELEAIDHACKALGGWRLPGVPPTGGVLLMLGWLLLAGSAIRRRA